MRAGDVMVRRNPTTPFSGKALSKAVKAGGRGIVIRSAQPIDECGKIADSTHSFERFEKHSNLPGQSAGRFRPFAESTDKPNPESFAVCHGNVSFINIDIRIGEW